MFDFSDAREKMVDCQVRTADVTSHGLISAMLSVPREQFVAEDKRELAYIDEDLSLAPLGPPNRFLMEPAPFARLLQLGDVKPTDVVLVIGAGSGYSAAVLSILCSSVVAVEEDSILADIAEKTLSELGYDNVAVVKGPLTAGWATEAPFDVIFMDGAVDHVPDAITDQLQDGGRLVAVEGTGNSGVARLYLREDGNVGSRDIMNCAIQPLPGFQKEAVFEF